MTTPNETAGLLRFYKTLSRESEKHNRHLKTALAESNKALQWAIETLTITAQTLDKMHATNETTLRERTNARTNR